MDNHHGISLVRAPNPSFMTGAGTNTWIVGNVVVDPGPEDSAHLDALTAVAPQPTHILVSHSHADHSAGADALKRETGAVLLAAQAGQGCTPDDLLVDGWRVDTAAGPLRAIATPGHTSDSFCFSLDSAGVLFSGDHIMNGSTVVIAPPDGDMTAYMRSLNRVDGLLLDCIFPGHGDVIDDPQLHIKHLVGHRRERQGQVFQALAWRVEATASDLVDDVYRPIDPQLVEVATMQIWAHLRALQDDNLVQTDDRNDAGALWSVATGSTGPIPLQ